MPEQADLLKRDSLKGKVAVIFGPLPDNCEHHKKLVDSRPLALIHIDHRLPFNWAKNDGAFPLWIKKYGFPPMVTIPFMEAWEWKKRGVRCVRVKSKIEMAPAESTNVVAELPGSEPKSGLILLGAHHDSQASNVGADDNASGVVSLLELARLLKPLRRKRSIRLISFGTEEQLSV
ncbi:hypothetical protein ES703_80174 [subsurface metagenome]